MKCFMYILLLITLTSVSAQDRMRKKVPKTCSECLLKGGNFDWCVDEKFKFNRTRCNTKANLEKQGCKEYGMGSGSKSDNANKDFDDVIQVKPQSITLKLRPGETQQFTIQIKPAKNYPVDLYYLMDMSKSMLDDLEKLTTLGTKIAHEIRNITTNYRLAFGSFVDKPLSPFVQDEDPNYSHCKIEQTGQLCVPAFGFRHIFNFSERAELFENAVREQNISGNRDLPEGGFDGLMQVTVCDKELGWKDKAGARKIVVFVTDATPHIAGDGRILDLRDTMTYPGTLLLFTMSCNNKSSIPISDHCVLKTKNYAMPNHLQIAGIVRPNDGRCHIERQGNFQIYTESKTMDYPSIGLLKAKLKENKVIPIFAVTKNVSNVYKKLANEWKNLSAVTGILQDDSSNIVELIRDNYAAISTTIKLSDDSGPDITVAYKAQDNETHPNHCPNVIAPNECADVKVKEGDSGRKHPVDFAVNVTANANSCNSDAKKNQNFTISIPGFGDTRITIEMICSCECSKTRQENSTKCTGHGAYTCTSCECNEGRKGDKCQCDEIENADVSACKVSNETDQICSGFGECVCGVCQCDIREDPNEIIYGKYCDCNNYKCQRHKSLPCGGEGFGKCICGNCSCEVGYTGENCGKKDCNIAAKDCLSPNGEICSKNGKCECGECDCNKGYVGKHCEICVDCPGICINNRDCILCQEFQELNLVDKDVCDNCSKLDIKMVDEAIEQCVVPINDRCFIIFSYETNEVLKNLTFHVLQKTRCIEIKKTKIPLLAIILGTIGGIVFLGLVLLLLWKLIITAYDNYEYQKFEKETLKAQWVAHESRLYQPAKQQFENPSYGGNQ